MKLLKKHQLHVAFPALTKLYLILLTLPVGSTKCERSFSKLKIIKNRLRQTMNQERLEAILLLSIENDLINTIDSDIVLDTEIFKIEITQLDNYLYSNRSIRWNESMKLYIILKYFLFLQPFMWYTYIWCIVQTL